MSLTFDTNVIVNSGKTTSVPQIGINGVKMFSGICETEAATAAKVVTCPEFGATTDLVSGVIVWVKFSYTNTASAANLTLSVNSSEAKNIKVIYNGNVAAASAGDLHAGASIPFTYDGTYWILLSTDYNTNTSVTQTDRTTDATYNVLFSVDTNTTVTKTNGTYKSANLTFNPSSKVLNINSKPALYGEYAGSAPSSPVTGQLWLKQADMTVQEAKVLVVSKTTSSLPTTISNSNITADMVVVKHEVGNPSLVSGTLSFAMAAGSATISGSLSGSTTITLYLLRSR